MEGDPMNNMNTETTDTTPMKEVNDAAVYLETLNSNEYQRRQGNKWEHDVDMSTMHHSITCVLSFGFECHICTSVETESKTFPTFKDSSLKMIILNEQFDLFVPLDSINSNFVDGLECDVLSIHPLFPLLHSFPDINQMVIDYFVPLMNKAQDDAIEILKEAALPESGLVQRYLFDLVNPTDFMPCGNCGNVVSDIMFNWDNDECVLCCSVSEVNE